MQQRSSITITPAEPIDEPACWSEVKSILTSTSSAVRIGVEEPPGMTALSARPALTARIAHQTPDDPAAVVTEQINAVEFGQRLAAVYQSAGDGAAGAVVVLEHRLDEIRSLGRSPLIRVRPFPVVPA